MRVAVTVWEDCISPVFDASRHLLIAKMENGQITHQSNLIFDPEHPANLAITLIQLDHRRIKSRQSQWSANSPFNNGDDHERGQAKQ
jgi:hypothetical protein